MLTSRTDGKDRPLATLRSGEGQDLQAAIRRGTVGPPSRSPSMLAAVLVVFLAVQSARSQETTPQPPKPEPEKKLEQIPIPVDLEGNPVLVLTLEDALSLGRLHNSVLKSRELDPLIARENLRFAQSEFEPEMYSELGFAKSKDSARNVFQPSLTRETWDGRFGVRQKVSTGGTFDMSYSPLRLRQSTTTPGFPSKQYSSDFTATYVQPLMRGGWSDYTRREIVREQARLVGAGAAFRRSVQETMLAIVRAYWDLVFARENYRVVSASLDLAREQLRITMERIRVRELAERDRVADEAEVARQRESAITAENSIRDAEDALRRLLFDDADGNLWRRNLQPSSDYVPDLETPVPDWKIPARIALTQRPDLRTLRTQVAVAEVDALVAQRDVLPQLDLVGSYSTDSVRPGFDDAWSDTWNQEFPDWSVRLQFSIPIGNTAALSRRDSTRLDLERRKRELYSAEIDVAAEVRQAVRRLETLKLSIAASLESRRLAETNLDTERVKLRVGTSTVFEVQRRIQELQEARSRLLRNQLDYRIAEAEMLYAQGLLDAPGERVDDSQSEPGTGR